MASIIERALSDINKLQNCKTPVLFYYNGKTHKLVASDKVGNVAFMNELRTLIRFSKRSYTFTLHPSDIEDIKNVFLSYLNTNTMIWSPTSKGINFYSVFQLNTESGVISTISKVRYIKLINFRLVTRIMRVINPNIRKIYNYIKNCSN